MFLFNDDKKKDYFKDVKYDLKNLNLGVAKRVTEDNLIIRTVLYFGQNGLS